MDLSAENSWAYIKIFLRGLGHWPYQSWLEKKIVKYSFFTILVTANIPISMYSMMQWAALYEIRNDIDIIMDQLPMVMTGVLFYINFTTLTLQQSKMRVILEMIKEDFQMVLKGSEGEKGVLRKSVEQGKTAVFIALAAAMGATVAFCVMALIPVFLDVIIPLNETRTRNYVYDANYVIIDKDKYYYSVFCHAIIAGLYSIGNTVATDATLFYFLQHSCGMFNVLGYKLRHVIDISKKKYNPSDRDYIDWKNEIIICLNTHEKNLRLVKEIEACFSISLFFTMGITAMILSFQGVMIIVKIDEPDLVMRCAINFFSQALVLFYNCLAGQNLVNSSCSLFQDIYESHWNLMPTTHRKMILIMLVRCSRECNMTIGKTLTLSMETYSSLMKTVFSYLSVLGSVRA